MKRRNVWPEILLLVSVFFLARAAAGCTLPPEPDVPEPGATSDCRGAAAVLEELGGCGLETACTFDQSQCRTFRDSCEEHERDKPGYMAVACLVVARDCDAFLSCGGE
jgi:hypothetical protein